MASCTAVAATCSCIASLCVVCYWNSLFGDLVHDDVFAIVNNQDLRSETPLLSLLHNDFWGKPMSDPTSHKSYRPLCVLSFRLNDALHGLDPWGYHAVNVLLHVVCTLCFWWACRKIVFRDEGASVVAGLMFAAHPVHVEAVSESKLRSHGGSCLWLGWSKWEKIAVRTCVFAPISCL